MDLDVGDALQQMRGKAMSQPATTSFCRSAGNLAEQKGIGARYHRGRSGRE